jgi:hypothetical protein
MLEFFRKHKGAFLITLTVIIIISFSIWGGWKGTQEDPYNANARAFTVYGKDYTIAEAQRMNRYMEPIRMLQMFDLYIGLMSIARDESGEQPDFILNMLVLRHEMKKAGIHPGDSEARAELEKLPALQENGKFSLQRAQMMEQNLGYMGMNGQDLLEIMKLKLGLEALQNLVGKNYVPSPFIVEKNYANQYQTVKLSTISFLLEDFKKNAQVTDEEIKKYFDENKDTFKTPERRAVSYVFFEDPKDLDKLPLEERQKTQQAAVQKIITFSEAVTEDGAQFAKVAAEQKVPVQTLPLFARDAAPEAIKAEADLINAIFHSTKPVGAASDPVKGSKGYYIVTVTQIEEPKPQELAAVRDKVKETLVNQKATEALGKAVNDARTALAEGLKAGKKIEELAKEKNLTLSPVTDFDPASPPEAVPNAYKIAPQAQETAPGELSPVIDTDDGAMLVFVHAKELRKRDDSAALRKNSEETAARQARDRLFSAWFSRKRDEAGIRMNDIRRA